MGFLSTAKPGDNVLGSVRPSVTTLLAEPFDLRPYSFARRLTLTLARMSMYVKVVGQRSRSNGRC